MAERPATIDVVEAEPLEARAHAVEHVARAAGDAARAAEAPFPTARVDRAAITAKARDTALEAADLVEEAMDADIRADEARRLAIIARDSHDREQIRLARQHTREARREAKQAHKSATKLAKEAYDAVKFSTPGKLGFMRFVQVVFAWNIVSTLFALLMTSRDVIVYDSFTIMNWVEIVLEGVAFWFFVNRYKVARPFVMATSAFGIVVTLIVEFISGRFELSVILSSCAWYLFLLLYFTFSKRVKAVLVNDLSTLRPAAADADVQINRKGWPFVRNLIIYFVVFSVLGHWMEAAMCQLIRLGIVRGEYDPTNTMLWRDWLYPFPMEGAAVVLIALVLYPLWRTLMKMWPDKPYLGYIASFCANAFACALIEFFTGIFVNADHQLWDYTDMPFNLLGQVCLQNMAAFGVAASLFCWIVYPLIERWIARIPAETMNIAFIVVAIVGGILWSLYLVDPPENHQERIARAIPTPSQVMDRAVNLTLEAMSVSGAIDSLQLVLDGSRNLTEEQRAEIQKEIDELKESAARIEAVLREAAQPTGRGFAGLPDAWTFGWG